jgi:hypothetical protein
MKSKSTGTNDSTTTPRLMSRVVGKLRGTGRRKGKNFVDAQMAVNGYAKMGQF